MNYQPLTAEERQLLRDLIDAKKRADMQAAENGERSKRAGYWRKYYRENRRRIQAQRLARREAAA